MSLVDIEPEANLLLDEFSVLLGNNQNPKRNTNSAQHNKTPTEYETDGTEETKSKTDKLVDLR